MSDLAARLGDLGPTGQRALLARLLELRRGLGETAPLSHAQRQLWFLEKLAAGNPFYNESSALRFLAPLDPPALERTINEIVARHEVLRTNFEEADGEPVQRILQALRVPLPLIDLSGAPRGHREAETARLIDEQARTPFDLARAPLLRVCLIRLAPADHVLALTMHHIVCDGWSMRVLFREMQLLYAAFAAGRPSPLPPLRFQYRDYGAWQRGRLGDGLLESQLRYWQHRLRGLRPLELPTDRPRPTVPSFAGRRVALFVAAATGRRMRALCDHTSVTPFMALLAAFQALLHRYSGQDDIAVGCPVASRSRPEWEPLLGFFVNTLVIRTDLGGAPSFRELLRRVREVALGAFAHQDLPFETLVERLQPERHPGRNPLFQVTFQILADDGAPATATAHVLEAVDVPATTAKFDLRCDLWPDGDGFRGYLEYSADLLDEPTVRAMARHFEAAVGAMVDAPMLPVAELRLSPLPEQASRLSVCTETAVRFPPAMPVHRRVEAIAATAPQRPAVSDGASALDYGELNRRANRLARLLVARGVQPGCLVVLLLERSVELVVAALAVLKTGAAYVPLDPAYPPERIGLLMRRALAPVALTTTAHRAAAPGFVPALCLDAPPPELVAFDDTDLELQIDDQALAYVVFTSGSTGTPRGVEVRHASLNNLIDWHVREYEVTPADRASLCASPAFDASVWECWPYLAAGAGLHVPDAATLADPVALAAWMAEQRITLSFLPTPLAELFLDAPLHGDLALRALLTGGDRLRRPPTRPLPFRFVNHYGPTECTVVATWCDVAPSTPGAPPPPIGRPIANITAHVLDTRRRPVPCGACGELYLGGAGLARGYLGDAEATRHQFVPNPFDGGRTRLYRTGDRVRQRGDGLLEFHGRLDDQIKLRGFRIEPVEVEAAIDRDPAVVGSAVAARVCDPGVADEATLVAYVVTHEDGSAAAADADARVADWQATYDRVYGGDGPDRDDEFDVVGWTSSYTGEPLPHDELREQFDGAADRVRELRGRRILEIGCGTGLMLLRLARGCERYVGTDFSGEALARLGRVLERRGWGHVELFRRRADDFGDFAACEFDGVVLHSVVQYFPDAAYLLRVLEGAARAARPGGWVYVGDVRNLRTAELLYAAVERARAGPESMAGELRAAAERRAAREVELLIDPELFAALPSRLPGFASARLRVRRGRSHNELTRHRYDAVLRVGAPVPAVPAAELRWAELGRLSALRRALAGRPGEPLHVRGVPSALLVAERAFHERLRRAAADEPVEVLATADHAGIEPEQLRELARQLGRRAWIEWSRRDDPATYDVLFAPGAGDDLDAARSGDAPPERPWAAWTNAPLSPAADHELFERLRARLRRELPQHMVPASFVRVATLPLTPNGKLDRSALTGIVAAPPPRTHAAPPRNRLEHRVAAIWREVLGLERVGAHDNFFDIGGHSLLLVKVHHRLREAFGPRLTLVDLFRLPTVADVATALAEGGSADGADIDTAPRPAAAGASTVPLAGEGGVS
jgi:amino acid adenylation domain-containing protein